MKQPSNDLDIFSVGIFQMHKQEHNLVMLIFSRCNNRNSQDIEITKHLNETTEQHNHNLEMLAHLGLNRHIIPLLAFQLLPFPFYSTPCVKVSLAKHRQYFFMNIRNGFIRVQVLRIPHPLYLNQMTF